MIVIGSMISLGYYLPVIAAMWMREAPAGEGALTEPASPLDVPALPGEALPVLAGGSPELDAEPSSRAAQPEVADRRVRRGRRDARSSGSSRSRCSTSCTTPAARSAGFSERGPERGGRRTSARSPPARQVGDARRARLRFEYELS